MTASTCPQWLRDELDRARRRLSQLPKHARPAVQKRVLPPDPSDPTDLRVPPFERVSNIDFDEAWADSDVTCPRPDGEVIASAVADQAETQSPRSKRVWEIARDVGCSSQTARAVLAAAGIATKSTSSKVSAEVRDAVMTSARSGEKGPMTVWVVRATDTSGHDRIVPDLATGQSVCDDLLARLGRGYEVVEDWADVNVPEARTRRWMRFIREGGREYVQSVTSEVVDPSGSWFENQPPLLPPGERPGGGA